MNDYIDSCKFDDIISKTSAIIKDYSEAHTNSGRAFNIFSIMGMESNEVYTHSAFIAELLNPQGSHGFRDEFLRLFFETISPLSEIRPFDFENAVVIKEEFVGTIDDDYTTGGYIDIVVKDLNNIIVIENKIYAADQRGQLIRYKQNYQSCKLLYLTLFGNRPSEISFKSPIVDLCIRESEITLISYRDDILNWLYKCSEFATKQPKVHVLIEHYIFLVEKLTNQGVEYKMRQKIKELITEENIDSIAFLSNELQSIVYETKSKFLKLLGEEFKIPVFNICPVNYIHVEFGEDRDGFWIGYKYFENGENKSSSETGKKLRLIFKQQMKESYSNDQWIGWYHPYLFQRRTKFEDLDKKEILKMFKSDSYLTAVVGRIVSEANNFHDSYIDLVKDEPNIYLRDDITKNAN